MPKIYSSARLIVVVVFVLSLLAGATTTVLADTADGEGSFDVLVLKNGDWQFQGELSFYDYETLHLPLNNDAGQLTLRLEQYGHDGSYVDYVTVRKENTTYLPVSAINVDSGVDVLTKV
jgi:hypothetical protein